MMITLPGLLNVGALSLLVMFIFAVLGSFLFGDVSKGDVIDD